MDRRSGQFGKTTIGIAAALLLGLAAGPGDAAANASLATAESPAAVSPTFGKTLPPVGFVGFCGRRPVACAARVGSHGRPRLTARQWELVARVNSFVNNDVTPASDQEVYGEPEHWDYPGRRGDCEDYALLKQRYLEVLGLPRSALLLTVVLDDHQEGHAVLTLATSEGDFILDNRRDGIRRWSDSDYTFLKRQSQRDPREWEALTPEAPAASAAVAARTER